MAETMAETYDVKNLPRGVRGTRETMTREELAEEMAEATLRRNQYAAEAQECLARYRRDTNGQFMAYFEAREAREKRDEQAAHIKAIRAFLRGIK